MKKLLYICLFTSLFAVSCKTYDYMPLSIVIKPDFSTIDFHNVSYGQDPKQTMDVYFPKNAETSEKSKTIILIHGGSWISGDKIKMNSWVNVFKDRFPDYAIVNINYRLATPSSPAFPKQIDDIEKAIQYLERNYPVTQEYALLGVSAGAHLAMLYSYKSDVTHKVKAVCDIVGPADFTDPAYTSHKLYDFAAMNLTGSASPTAREIYNLSPIEYITPQSPPTIMFYGSRDPMVPSTQGYRLKDKLDEQGVYNIQNLYVNGGHGNWGEATLNEVQDQAVAFIKEFL
ncbi:alpha/beta hydrolase fold domain-containing protein [Flavobacterium rhizosphaerae]|uniref:Alpha/beta hydrolase n=1 Tax=Flavobacterium rhizosphaerae TaxID=3163298 RepID=A0ABW8Z043_9FLAO